MSTHHEQLSEIAVHTSAVITELFPKYMDSSCYRLVNGGVEETTALLQHRFDHIFYTGGGQVGRIIMTAAAKHLTPVTLELGGKWYVRNTRTVTCYSPHYIHSPAVITADADMKTVAQRIAFGKFFNTGQSCIAVDYVLVPRTHVDAIVQAMQQVVANWFGQNPKGSKDYGRIINTRHFDRIAGLLERRGSGTIVIGGDMDREERYIAPTVVKDVSFQDAGLMTEEIFGPILPIVAYNEIQDAVAMINRQ